MDHDPEAHESIPTETVDSPRTPPRRGVRTRVVAYGSLAVAIVVAYLFANTAMIPGVDPYFANRQTVDAEIIERDGQRFLWGGEDEDQWFDITEFHLDPKRLEYGLGREAFPALIDPAFETMDEADRWMSDGNRVLIAQSGDDVHVYPIRLMRQHEAVNDVVGGRPVLAAYCLLADLGAVYDRKVGDTTYTFGVSGYTYYDWKVWNGYSAFVLWDRETESLWWPPIGKAVSGPSIDVPMRVLDNDLWAQSTWGEVRDRYPNARVLSQTQNWTPPETWERRPPPDPESIERDAPQIAPRWGRNSELD